MEEDIYQKLNRVVSGVAGHLHVMADDGDVEIDLPSATPLASVAEAVPAYGKQAEQQDQKQRLLALRDVVMQCVKCKELVDHRHTIVFGAGNAQARLCFVGEAPGHDEDLQGVPFVGRAGQLLTKIIESIGLTREDVFIANVLKCRPPQNRNPRPEEIACCEAYLVEQLAIIQPQIICALGTFAAQTLLKTTESISRLRGRFHDYHGIKLIPTYHPAFLLRSPEYKKPVWEDMKKIRAELNA